MKEEIRQQNPESPSENDKQEEIHNKIEIKLEVNDTSQWDSEQEIKSEEVEVYPSCLVQVEIKREDSQHDGEDISPDDLPPVEEDPSSIQHQALEYIQQFQAAVSMMVADGWQRQQLGGDTSSLRQAVNSIIGNTQYYAPPDLNTAQIKHEGESTKHEMTNFIDDEITLRDGKYSSYVKKDKLNQHILTSHCSIADKEIVKDEYTTVNGKYICSYCKKVYTKKYNCQQHILSVHEKKVFKKSDVDFIFDDGKYFCPLCDKIFAKKYNCRQHILTHARKEKREKVKPEPNECHFSGKIVYSSSALTNHIRTHTGEKPFQCRNCLRTFTVKANWVTHERAKKCYSVEDLTCKVCGKIFPKKVLYLSHMRSHMTVNEFICDLCNESFKYRSTLVRHIKTHNGEKPFSCPVCAKAFRHGGLLKPHMRTHTGERPYSCPICNKRFSLKHNLQKHLKTHRRPKKTTCDVCHKVFPRESRLRYHMQRHTQEKPFQCDLCFRVFSHKQNVLRHIIAKHPDTIKWYD